MPAGAILSPPASPPDSNTSSDDELPEMRGRQVESLQALHDAISQIPQVRSNSPDKVDAGDLLVLPSQANAAKVALHTSFSTGSLDGLAGGRRFSHTRSATEPNMVISKSAGNSLTASEEDSDEEILRSKPQMVRKKSGELVRPALRPSSRRRPSSMPGTPTFSKAVHFDSHLEHVRHFLAVDRPQAVSAGSSPADNYESDGEYPFPGDDRSAVGRTPPFEWEIAVTNYPAETEARKNQVVRLERVWLSNDQKSLIGSVAVANLAFQKLVTCRFTLDYWKTTSEVAAEYVCEIRPKETEHGTDRFSFTIKLSDLANLESKTMYFCIRYNVNGTEYWDNNGGTNFQVDFRKKLLPMNGKRGSGGAASRPANGLPKSNRRSGQSPSAMKRSTLIPAMDEFGDSVKLDFDQSIHDYLGESEPVIRLKGVKSSGNIPSDNLSGRLATPTGQAFANRYSFGASLSAAIQTTKDSSSKPDGLYMKAHRRPTGPVLTVAPAAAPAPAPAPAKASASAPLKVVNAKSTVPPAQASAPKSTPAVTPVNTTKSFNNGMPSSTSTPGLESPPASASIASSSYEELVNKYCFFGSKPVSRYDGADDSFGTNSTTSTAGSPTRNPGLYHHAFGAQHHTLVRPREPVNYMQATHEALSKGLQTQRGGSPSAGQSGQAPSESLSPFASFAGGSPNEFPYQQQDRFPFSGPDGHAPTAIRG